MTSTTAARSRLDPRRPLVLDTRELGRRPGSLRRVSRTSPSPSQLGGDLLAVRAGAPIRLELRLESVVEGVLVSGTATAPVTGECSRCLGPVDTEVEVDLQELYLYGPPGRRGVPAADDDDLPQVVDDLIDLEPAVRDAVVLSLPVSPRCRDDCPGLCVECGARLADVGPRHTHAQSDPRWDGLRGLMENKENE